MGSLGLVARGVCEKDLHLIWRKVFDRLTVRRNVRNFPTMENTEHKTAPTLDEILALEEKVWAALVEGNAEADRALLSPDFLGVYPTGFANRDDHVGQFADAPTMARFELSETKLRVLSPDIVLLSYRADYQRPDADEWEAMLISSLWERRLDVWINSFSQDTPTEAK